MIAGKDKSRSCTGVEEEKGLLCACCGCPAGTKGGSPALQPCPQLCRIIPQGQLCQLYLCRSSGVLLCLQGDHSTPELPRLPRGSASTSLLLQFLSFILSRLPLLYLNLKPSSLFFILFPFILHLLPLPSAGLCLSGVSGLRGGFWCSVPSQGLHFHL